MSDAMLTRGLGDTGIVASAVGLGTWAIGGWMWGGTDTARAIAAIQASVDEGITLIDTAPAYGQGVAEEIVGRALKGRRDKVVLATKCGLVWHTDKGRHFFFVDGRPVHRYLGRDAIVDEVEQSLRRLNTDRIDHYITHWRRSRASRPRARSVRSARATCPPKSWPRMSRRVGWTPFRRSTACSSATSRRPCCPFAASTGSRR